MSEAKSLFTCILTAATPPAGPEIHGKCPGHSIRDCGSVRCYKRVRAMNPNALPAEDARARQIVRTLEIHAEQLRLLNST